MKAEFNEKNYEILVDREIINYFINNNLNFAYYIPSQREEYKIGTDFLFKNTMGIYILCQYKVPYEYKRKSKLLGGQRTFKIDLHKKTIIIRIIYYIMLICFHHF